MTPKQRLRVEELFHIAAELPATQRPEYLDVACGNDREVREEVESLLDAEVMSMASQFQTGAAALVEPRVPARPMAAAAPAWAARSSTTKDG